MSDQIYDHVSEFLAGLNTDDDTAAQVRRAVSDTFGASASAAAVDPKGRFRVTEYRVVVLADAGAVAAYDPAEMASEVEERGMLHTFEVVSTAAVGDDTISKLAEEAGGDPGWFLGDTEQLEDVDIF